MLSSNKSWKKRNHFISSWRRLPVNLASSTRKFQNTILRLSRPKQERHCQLCVTLSKPTTIFLMSEAWLRKVEISLLGSFPPFGQIKLDIMDLSCIEINLHGNIFRITKDPNAKELREELTGL